MSTSLSVSAVRPHVKHPDESLLYGIDFTPLLVSGELLSSVTSVAGSPAGLTISGSIVNGTAFDNDEGGTVAIGKGAQLRIAGGAAGSDYLITAAVGTTAGNTRVVVCNLLVRDR